MKTYEIKIQGVAAMLQNRLSKDLIDEMKEIPNAKKEEWDEQNWEKKLYKDNSDNIIIPENVIYAHLQEACKKYKVNPPKSIGRTWTAYFKASVIPAENAIIKNAEVTPFGTMVNGSPSSSKGSSKVYRIRPLIKAGWITTIKIIDVGDYLNEKLVEDIIKTGGQFVGLCDWRPYHGRYKVLSVKGGENV